MFSLSAMSSSARGTTWCAMLWSIANARTGCERSADLGSCDSKSSASLRSSMCHNRGAAIGIVIGIEFYLIVDSSVSTVLLVPFEGLEARAFCHRVRVRAEGASERRPRDQHVLQFCHRREHFRESRSELRVEHQYNPQSTDLWAEHYCTR